jgi:hypothetical protein
MVWDDYHTTRMSHQLDLGRQHDVMRKKEDAPKLIGPLHIDFVFVFTKHPRFPRLFAPPYPLEDLVKYVHHIAKERLYDPDNVVSSSAHKMYGEESQTQFLVTLKEASHGKKNQS